MGSKPYIILLDGPKGSGKTSVARLLKEKLPQVDFLSLDEERRKIPNARATTEFNRQAFDIILSKIESAFDSGRGIVLDSGLSRVRVEAIEAIAQKCAASIFKYALIAPRDVLLSRVRARDEKKSKATDEERFMYTYTQQQSKDFHDFTVFDTSNTLSVDIAAKILNESSKL